MDAKRAVWLLSQMFLIQFDKEEHEALGMAIDALNENAALKARLENAVELPCKFGEQLYSIRTRSDSKKSMIGRALTVNARNLGFVIENYGKTLFPKAEAQAKLDEMKGGADKCNG